MVSRQLPSTGVETQGWPMVRAFVYSIRPRPPGAKADQLLVGTAPALE